VLGVQFREDYWNGLSCAPYKVLEPNSFVFAGTGLKAGDAFGAEAADLYNGCGQAAGFEMDVTTPDSPKNLVLLAKGENILAGTMDTQDPRAAEMIYYDHPGGGSVFSVGSITFEGSIGVDPLVTKILRNVLGHDGISPKP